MEKRTVDDLVEDITRLLPPGLGQMQQDLEKNLRELLNSSFSRMGLVSREEFDVQCQLLSRTRAKLEALEQQLAELENKTSQ